MVCSHRSTHQLVAKRETVTLQGGHMKKYARIIATIALLLGVAMPGLSQESTPIRTALTLVPYACRHASCEDVAKLLRPLLPDDSREVQLVVDREQNRLLLAGPDYVHGVIDRLLAEVDQPAERRVVASVARTMQTYTVPAQLQAAFSQELTSRFANRIRFSGDAKSQRFFVWAAEDVHAVVEELAKRFTSGEPTVPRNQNPVTLREPAGAVPLPGAEPPHPRFVRVAPGQMDRVQNQLLAIFTASLAVRTVGTRQIYVLNQHDPDARPLEIEFDRVRSGILVGGEGRAARQLLALIDSLSRVDPPGRRAKVFRLRRDSHQKLQQVLQESADSVSNEDAPILGSPDGHPAPTAPIVKRFPVEEPGGIRLVRYLFQEADSPEGNAAAVATEVPVETSRQFEGVDIESLPELDVIILRGTDQDLEQLAEIIQQLERISQETLPEIHIYHLQHAQSQAVTELLNQISDDLVGSRQGRVSTLPLVKPNAILIVGWGDAVAATEELLAKLDTPVAPESQSEVFRLKHASATAVQQTLQAFFANRGGLGPRLQVATDPRTNSVIVYAAPRDMDEIRRLIDEIDLPEGEAVNRARVIQIENALATDVADTLQQAIQAAAGNGERAAALELQTFDANGQRILRSGTLQDVQITPNVRNNTLIVSCPIENLELVTELIRQLDTPVGTAKIKVFRIINGDATSLVQTLRSLIPSQTGANAAANQLSATGEAGLAPLRFSVDVRSNSIIATGSEGDLRIVEALLAKLDQTTSMQRKTVVYRLKNSPAIDVANAVNQYLFSRRQLEGAIPGQQNPFAEIEREVVVVPEPIANKLILAATPRYFEEIERLIEKLDESPPQVLIQVLIAEVALNNADEFGVELGLQDSVLFDRSLLGDLLTTSVTQQTSTANGIVSTTQDLVQAATNIPGFAFNSTQPLGNSGSSTALQGAGTVGAQGLSNFAVGRANDQLGFGGLVLSASSKNVSVLLRALRENRRVDVLSRPQIRTLDNQPAFIQVGQRVPRIVGSTVNQNGQSNSVSLENVGLILGVTPRVSPDGTVVMEIDAEKSSLGPEQDGIPVAVSVDGTVIRSPRVDTTTAQATVSAADGETIVLGGLITENEQYVHRSVPLLGNLPILEHVFRFDSNIQRRTELLIVLTPHVIRSPEDNERIRQLEMARMSWCACDVFSLMDDMGYFPESNLNQVEVGTPEVIYPDLDPTGEGDLMLPPEPQTDVLPLEPRTSVLQSPTNQAAAQRANVVERK